MTWRETRHSPHSQEHNSQRLKEEGRLRQEMKHLRLRPSSDNFDQARTRAARESDTPAWCSEVLGQFQLAMVLATEGCSEPAFGISEITLHGHCTLPFHHNVLIEHVNGHTVDTHSEHRWRKTTRMMCIETTASKIHRADPRSRESTTLGPPSIRPAIRNFTH